MTDYTDILTQWLPPVIVPFVGVVVQLVVLLAAGVVATWVLRFALSRMEDAVAGRLGDRDLRGEYRKRASTLFGLSKTIAITFLWAIVLIMMLSTAGMDITPILASAGILGLAVGFGAQNLVRDVITGFFHILENQIRVGDVVTINGTGGLVEAVTYRIIVLRDLHQNVHVIPHGRVDTLTNMTKDQSAIVLDVGVAYKTDVDEAMAVLQQVGEEIRKDEEWGPKILEDYEIMGLDNFADSALVIRTRFKTMPLAQWAVGREMRRRIKIAFDRTGIEFPFPHQTVFFDESSAPLRVYQEAAPIRASELVEEESEHGPGGNLD